MKTRFASPLLALLLSLLAGTTLARSPLSISNEPLGTSTGLSVKPNLWFILDDSGSMDSTFTPDWVNNSLCQRDVATPGNTYTCDVGDVPYMAAGFNRSYYNPEITYSPPLNADGSSKGNATPTAAKGEPFIYPSATSRLSTCYASTVGTGNGTCDLTLRWPRKLFCDSTVSGGGNVTSSNCKENVAATPYSYPSSTYLYNAQPPTATITRVARTSNVATVTTSAAHRLSAGVTLSVDATTDNTFDGVVTVASVPTTTTFTYTSTGSNKATTNDSGTVTLSAGAPYYYVMAGNPAWCTSAALSFCPGTRWSATNAYPRFTAYGGTNGSPSYMTLTITRAGYTGTTVTTASVSSLVYNNGGSLQRTILGTPITVTGKDSNNNRNALALAIANGIGNGFTAVVTSSCAASSASPGTCSPVVKISAPGSTTSATNTTYDGKSLTVNRSGTTANITTTASGNFLNAQNYSASNTAVAFTRVDIVPSNNSYTAYPNRTDCSGTCTYAQELQNFANWYAYYRGRLLMMKSSIATAFGPVTDSAPGIGFRVGFSVISIGTSNAQSGFSELKLANFDATQKSSFYSKLFAISPNSYTPLRTALARAGQLYSGNIYTGSNDPVQYSCQQNYTFLATDGYWNTNIEPSTNFNKNASSNVGNQDGGSTSVPYFDALSSSDSLADIARYFYVTDLRTTMTDDVPKISGDELHTGATGMHQHMKTFTMGLGVDGNLGYNRNYRSGGSTDYQSILTGAANWGNPISDTAAGRIDDLWHAAVNGHGVYFSAADPSEVASGLAQTLAAAQQETGSSAAAATSNLEPVAGDNYAYVASYTTSVWDGNLEAKNIDLTTGAISDAASASLWSARDQLDSKAASSGRVLFTKPTSGSGRRSLVWSNLTGTEQTYFNPTLIPSCNPATLCPGTSAENMFNFLMGSSDATGYFRAREHVLGDIVKSQPVYVKGAKFSYSDDGYTAYKTSSASRAAAVYVGANDGFLHAFSGDTGEELWAYLPNALLSKLYKLADPAYQHDYYDDGSLTVGDIYVGGSWKTILVGGLNGGGRHYFALDITTPSAPSVLWEFTDSNMGNTYGNPVITKFNGNWVVLLTSGYNNGTTVGGDGAGRLYIVDAWAGSLQSTLSTGSGSAGSPSGLGKIANWVDDPMANNSTRYVYGGDLNGDLWRFDLGVPSATPAIAASATKIIATGKAITTRPELADINYQRTVFFATGLFLETAQRDRSAHVGNAIYGIRDTNLSSPVSAAALAQISVDSFLTQTGITETQWLTGHGWELNLSSGYFVDVDPKIQLGTLAVVANRPADTSGDATTSCTTDKGDHITYFISFSGGAVSDSSHAAVVGGTSLAVGINIIRLPDGKVKIITTTSDNKHVTDDVAIAAGTSRARRISWRELINR